MTITRGDVATPDYAAGWLVGQLPVGMRDDDMLVRFTAIFERLGATLRAAADGVEHAADATVTTPAMLTYLGRWLGYDVLDESLPVEQQRRIVAALGEALPLRGTVRGLSTLLVAITDGPVAIREPGSILDAEAPVPVLDRVEVHVASTGHLREHELRALVRDEVPAHLDVALVIDPETGTELT